MKQTDIMERALEIQAGLLEFTITKKIEPTDFILSGLRSGSMIHCRRGVNDG